MRHLLADLCTILKLLLLPTAIHSKKSLIFWVNVGQVEDELSNSVSRVRIERSLMDGSRRKTVISSKIGVPTDICIDQDDGGALFWIDIELRRLERSNLDGGNRLGLVSGDNFGPKNDKFSLGLVTVHGEYVYWGLRSSESINRINKRTGLDSKIIKSNAMHLSSLISVNAVSYVNNPCKGNS